MLIGHQSKFLKLAFLALALVRANRDIFFCMWYIYRNIEISGNMEMWKKKNMNNWLSEKHLV